MSTSPETAAGVHARRLLDAGASPHGACPPLPEGVTPSALAWALKDQCYDAWYTQPPRAALAAEWLQALAGASPAQTEVQALADWTAGIACVTRGQVADAVAHFDAAASGLRQVGQPDPAAQTQVPKIMALSMLGRHDEAAACAVATQRELRALGNLGAAARVSQNLGSLQLFRDQYPEAARHFREAAVLFARLENHEYSVMADIGLADSTTAMGDLDEAERLYARARMRAGHRGLALQEALVDESVSLLALARGRYRQALAGFESARRRFQSLAMPQYLAVAEKQLADAYLELRLLPEALALFEAAVLQFHALGLAVEEAWAQTQRGRTLALLGLGGADDAFGVASALFAAQANGVGSAAVDLARAELALAGGHSDKALVWAEAARAGYAAAGQAEGRARAELVHAQALLAAGRLVEAGEAFAATGARAKAAQQLQLQVPCLTGQGCVAQAQGDGVAASKAFEAAIELFEEQRSALPGDDIRAAFLSDHLRPYLECLRLALATGDAALVLQQLDRFRARTLDDRLDERSSEQAEPVPLDDETLALRDRVSWLQRRVRRVQDEGDAATALVHTLQQTERTLLERTRRQRLAAQGPALRRTADFSIAALQAALRPGDALVEYGATDGELWACVATATGVTLHRALGRWAEVQAAVQALRFQIDTLRHGAAAVQHHLPVLQARAQVRLQRLYAALWAPLAPRLQGCGRVLVVPHGALGLVPFAALDDGTGPLGARHALALAPSARAALRGLLRPPVAARHTLALGESSSLLHAADEARFVAALFAGGQALVGADATQAGLRALASQADVLHLACHAQFRSDNPRFSSLHLADGPLAVDEAETLPLRACTVVLSACETGVAEAGVGDESMGLVRAFLVAGAARVVASLWPVDDAITRRFMADFYRALASGSPASTALQHAQAATRQHAGHPFYWAAFALHGGW